MISDHMKILKEEYGFDTISVREECLFLAGKINGKEILDVATGSGWMAIVLAKASYNVTTIDINDEVISRAKKRAADEGICSLDKITYQIADAQNLPFQDNTFDGVFSFDSMHHMPNCSKVIREFSRVCKPNGVIMIADLNEKGLDAVRSVVQRDKENHYENACRVDMVGELLKNKFDDIESFKREFVTVYKIINNKIAEL